MNRREAHLRSGREAVRRQVWQTAFEQLSAADELGSLKPRDLEGLGYAAWLTGHQDASVSVRQRAHAAYLDVSDHRAAARTALAVNHIVRLCTVVAALCLRRTNILGALAGFLHTRLPTTRLSYHTGHRALRWLSHG
jgi:hypothetical protein